MFTLLKNYFSFSKGERNGLIILTLIMMTIIAVWILLPGIIKKEITNFDDFENQVNSFLASSQKNQTNEQAPTERELFFINPNTATEEDWENLGLKKYQSKIILNYINKGGKFFKKEDLKKIHSITNEQYNKIEPFLFFPETNKQQIYSVSQKTFFEFDPNCTNEEDFKRLGLSEKQITVISNFLSKGGKYKNKEDFKKMYCIPPHQYEELEPFISIEPVPEKTSDKFDTTLKIDINEADSADFTKIKGISPYLAKNIIKYREALGGFESVLQLKELKNMKPDTYNKIESQLIISQKIRKINLNIATFAEILKHPYIDYEATLAILKYKKIMTKIQSINELTENKIITDSLFQKIKTYITTQ